jgi:hypothetical protein
MFAKVQVETGICDFVYSVFLYHFHSPTNLLCYITLKEPNLYLSAGVSIGKTVRYSVAPLPIVGLWSQLVIQRQCVCRFGTRMERYTASASWRSWRYYLLFFFIYRQPCMLPQHGLSSGIGVLFFRSHSLRPRGASQTSGAIRWLIGVRWQLLVDGKSQLIKC